MKKKLTIGRVLRRAAARDLTFNEALDKLQRKQRQQKKDISANIKLEEINVAGLQAVHGTAGAIALIEDLCRLYRLSDEARTALIADLLRPK